MDQTEDRLYELLPAIIRTRDAEQGYPLRDLLRVIAEQVNLVESDIGQLYENWFIETCQDWAVPYLGDLIGYQPVHEAGEPGALTTPQSRQRNRILIPRREVANTVRYRRRKGTLALLEELAWATAGWPARAVEFYRLLAATQALNHLRLERGRTADLRQGDALDRLNGPFDPVAHTVDVRRVNSRATPGRYNLPEVGLFVSRLKAYRVTEAPAYCLDRNATRFTFSVLGNDAPLFIHSTLESDPTRIAGELNLPLPIRRRALATDPAAYYGPERSFQIWVGVPVPAAKALSAGEKVERKPLPVSALIVADLSDWYYRPPPGKVAVDPVLGRLAFHDPLPRQGVWVTYSYGFSADLGGGEYDRPLVEPEQARHYRVSKGRPGAHETIQAALEAWRNDPDRPSAAVIEIGDSGVYVEQLAIELEENQTLQLRAANHARPVLWLLNWGPNLPDALSVTGKAGSRFTLDGLLVTGRGLRVEGDLEELVIRHSTLVPGWELDSACEPVSGAEPSLELFVKQARVRIEQSIVGSIQVTHDEVTLEPLALTINDSIVDATGVGCAGPACEALGAPGWPLAHAVLTIARSTVIGRVQVHAIALAEDSLFLDQVRVGRRQTGCMRFCYVTPDSRTPRRYHCQPDLAEQAGEEALRADYARLEPPVTPTPAEVAAARQRARERVRPQFNSLRYGTPTYCQLAAACAAEIQRGAEDESELGVFHDLYQPQREANLRARLDEYTPAGMDAGIIYINI